MVVFYSKKTVIIIKKFQITIEFCLEILEQDWKCYDFTKVKYDLNLENDFSTKIGPMRLYEKDQKKCFGTNDKVRYSGMIDDKKDQIIYNYDKSKSTFMHEKNKRKYFIKCFFKIVN